MQVHGSIRNELEDFDMEKFKSNCCFVLWPLKFLKVKVSVWGLVIK